MESMISIGVGLAGGDAKKTESEKEMTKESTDRLKGDDHRFHCLHVHQLNLQWIRYSLLQLIEDQFENILRRSKKSKSSEQIKTNPFKSLVQF